MYPFVLCRLRPGPVTWPCCLLHVHLTSSGIRSGEQHPGWPCKRCLAVDARLPCVVLANTLETRFAVNRRLVERRSVNC